jgi:hypothetical protein
MIGAPGRLLVVSPHQILMTAQLRELALSRPLELGPYSLRTEELPAQHMPVRRRHGCLDLTHGRILLREGLQPAPWRRAFVHALVRLVHYAQAVLLHESTEEHLTHSLASGLSQLARRNPELTWALLRAINPHVRHSRRMPQRLVLGTQAWTVRSLPVKTAARLRVFGQADLERRRIELDPALSGTQLAVIFLHECIHGLHHECGVTDQTSLRIAHSREADALTHFWGSNPQAAGWWFGLLQPIAQAYEPNAVALRQNGSLSRLPARVQR